MRINVTPTKLIRIEIELSHEEARYLQGMVQNPINPEEGPICGSVREMIFMGLEKAVAFCLYRGVKMAQTEWFCCQKLQTRKFCPDCGCSRKTVDAPLCQLLVHCLSVAQQREGALEKAQKKAVEEHHSSQFHGKDWDEYWDEQIEFRTSRATKWRSWAEALRARLTKDRDK